MKLHERLLRVTLGRYEAAALLGDLEEEAARRAAPASWIRRQAMRYAASAVWLAVRRRRNRMLATTRLAFRDGWRSIYRFRATSLAAVLILGVSMAAGAVTFAVVDTIVLRPLPYPESDRLVSVSGKTPTDARAAVAPVDYYGWRAGTSSFEGLAAWRTWSFEPVDDPGRQPVTMVTATGSLFDVLRARPLIGTTFGEKNETPGRDAVAVISHSLWLRRYGGNPAVLGSQIATPTGMLSIIGVMPPDFGFPVDAAPAPAIWRPLAPKEEDRVITPDGGRAASLHVIGRLKDGVSLDQGRADVERVFASLRAADPGLYPEVQSRTELLHDTLTERVAGWMRLVLAAVAVLMAIGCVNVANLLLTRSAQRARDVSVRLSLGATRAHVTAGLLAESFLLSATASAAGLVAARWLLAFVKAALPAGIVRADSVHLDARVLTGCAIAGVLTALVSGLVPGWQASGVAPAQFLKDGSGATASPRRRRWQNILLIAQVALVTTLVVAATLLVGSFARVVGTDLGFSRQNLVGVRLALGGVRLAPAVPDGVEEVRFLRDFHTRAQEAVRSLSGVSSVAYLGGSSIPLYRVASLKFQVSRADREGTPIAVDFRRVSPGYFETAGIRIVEGRDFAPGDADQPVAVIDELAARHLFGSGSAIGQRLRPGGVTVIGVAANVRLLGPEGATQAQMYRLLGDEDAGTRFLLIRTSAPAAAVVPAIQSALAPVMGSHPGTIKVEVVDEEFRRLTADRRFNAGLMAALGLVALLIAASGVYATTASIVAQQTREIGIRMALGASAGRIVRRITAMTARLLLAAAAIGLTVAWTTSSVLESVLFGIRPTDALAYVVPLAIIGGGGLLATVVPAMKAARIDPLLTLRE